MKDFSELWFYFQISSALNSVGKHNAGPAFRHTPAVPEIRSPLHDYADWRRSQLLSIFF
jgi:hypothetical protein